MRYASIVLFALLATPSCAQQHANVPKIRFESVPNYFKYPSEMNLGELTGVTVNSKGHVVMASRSGNGGSLFNAAASQLIPVRIVSQDLNEPKGCPNIRDANKNEQRRAWD